MQLQLKNVGMIKEANVKIDGLTVIAGENDTGKSTVGKALTLLLKTELTSRQKYFKKVDLIPKDKLNSLDKYFKNNRKYGLKRLEELLFDNFLRTNYDLNPDSFNNENFIQMKFLSNKYLKIFYNKKNNSWEFDSKQSISIKDNLFFKDVTYIQTPLLWDLQSFFNSILQIKTQIEIEEDIKFDFSYPYLLWDLYGKLINKRIKHISHFHNEQISNIKNIINGEFVKKSSNNFIFKRNNVEIPLIDVAHGIKSFGILQILLENGYISDKGILILDEPEVHLHPKWQLEMANIIVKFVKYGVRILVNSHSPYMIQSLIKYVRDEKVVDKSNFYLAKKEKTYSIIENVNDDLNKIFKLLAEPMNEVFTL